QHALEAEGGRRRAPLGVIVVGRRLEPVEAARRRLRAGAAVDGRDRRPPQQGPLGSAAGFVDNPRPRGEGAGGGRGGRRRAPGPQQRGGDEVLPPVAHATRSATSAPARTESSDRRVPFHSPKTLAGRPPVTAASCQGRSNAGASGKAWPLASCS